MKQINYVTYEARFSDIGLDTVYNFYPNGVCDEYKYTYNEALKAYPLDEYDWVEMESE